jgi:type IV pilus assembly protein PilM
MLDRLKSLVQEPPPAIAFEISETGVAAARVSAHATVEFRPLKPGVLSVSPLRENVIDAGEFAETVRTLWASYGSRKRREVALILPDYATRMAVLDFDQFPSDPKEQLSLVRFRLKRSVPFDVDSAAVSYWAQVGPEKKNEKKYDVLAVVAPLEIVARYEAPFRTAGMNPGFVTTSVLAALELAPEAGLSVVAKLAGHVLTIVVRQKGTVKLVRCLEAPSQELDDIAAVLLPTFVYIEDNLGGAAESLFLCGFGAHLDAAQRRFQNELGVTVEPLRSPLDTPGESNAGLLGYLHSVSKN